MNTREAGHVKNMGVALNKALDVFDRELEITPASEHDLQHIRAQVANLSNFISAMITKHAISPQIPEEPGRAAAKVEERK